MEIINPEEGILSMADNNPALLPTKNLNKDKRRNRTWQTQEIVFPGRGEYVDFEEIKEE